MLIFPGMMSHPGWLLLSLGGLITLIVSLLMAVDQFRDAGERPGGHGEANESTEAPASNEPARPRSFVFIGFFAFPISFGGFWGGGPRRRTLGAFYLIGLLMVAAGAVFLLLG